MKLIAAPPQDFDVYVARPETLWGEREKDDSLERVYEQGFLPYSGSKDSRNIFYTARSARVVLKEFTLSSENRRIAKKFDGVFTKERVPSRDFNFDEDFYTFCLTYFASKQAARAMPRARLETIVNSGLLSNTTIYRSAGVPVAYVLEVAHGDMAHYWFSFYDLAFAKQSLGMWLMLDAIRSAKSAGLSYYYLGTVYGERALYKTNFEPLQWWDGKAWQRDVQKLKEHSRAEDF